jgi:pyrimidine-nucleoside phosphorylase
MNCLPLIEAKRDGQALTAEQIQSVVAAYTRGQIPDYQMAALLMAILFRGMDAAETRALTIALRDSGQRLQFPPDPRPLVDKHSTGGVGDKVSLVLAPLLASLGFRVPMISGRGLGITGGTLDKLESIPDFQTALPAKRIIDQVQKIGCIICAQTDDMVPADKVLYALRDATGTVPSIPLITASILSKKLAEGLDCLLLDVKFGSGAFMQTEAQARELAATMVRLGNECGVKTRALLTDMDVPLGRAVGNLLEVREAIECLESRGPADLEQLVIECAAHLFVLSSRTRRMNAARDHALQTLRSRQPLAKWQEMLAAQGVDPDACQTALTSRFAPAIIELRAEHSGFVERCDVRIIGEIVRDLGGGRMNKDSKIDPLVGVDQIARPGERVERGATLCRIHAANQAQARSAIASLGAAFEISASPPKTLPLIRDVVSE